MDMDTCLCGIGSLSFKPFRLKIECLTACWCISQWSTVCVYVRECDEMINSIESKNILGLNVTICIEVTSNFAFHANRIEWNYISDFPSSSFFYSNSSFTKRITIIGIRSFSSFEMACDWRTGMIEASHRFSLSLSVPSIAPATTRTYSLIVVDRLLYASAPRVSNPPQT